MFDAIYNKFFRIKPNMIMPFFMFLISFSLLIYSIASLNTDLYYPKQTLHLNIITAAENGADIKVIQTIYENSAIKRKILIFSQESKSNEYNINYPLSKILDNIIAESYLAEEVDVDTIKVIEAIKQEYNQTNPFDALEINQTELFDSIRRNTSKNYSLIENDMNKLAKELENKNNLVTKYLNKSNSSFTISIIALIVSLIIGTVQLFNGRKAKLVKIIQEAILNEVIHEENSIENDATQETEKDTENEKDTEQDEVE